MTTKNNRRKQISANKSRFKLLVYLLALFTSSTILAGRSTAFYYGKPVPIELLANFEQVVVEPDNLENPAPFIAKGIDVFAYLSVGEVNDSRPWYADVHPRWILGKNSAWGSQIIDLSQKEWQDYLINTLMTSLWAQGYRGFFLDTLDSYQLITNDPKKRFIQQQALLEIIRAMHDRFPGIKLILNRGFEFLPEVAQYTVAVAAESLFQSWNPTLNTFTEVPEADRDWLLKKLTQVHKKYGLQVIVIDYVSPKDRELARDVADKITEKGFTPWVSNPAMDMLGVGSLEVYPKRFLTLFDGEDKRGSPNESTTFKFLAYLLGLFGYAFDYIDARKGLPNYCLVGKYTRVLTWLHTEEWSQSVPLKSWLSRQTDDGMKVLALGKY